MKVFNLTCFLFLTALLGLGSCSKTGPTGPQGQQGPKGDQGTQGIPGADGSTIFGGQGAPADDLGENGDYYLDKSASDLYGPKTEDRWGTPLHLKGEKGEKGAAGEKGDKGDKGAKGDKGDPGQKGKAGKDGQAGSQILSGSSKPAASVGKVGDYYWDGSAYTLYGPKTTSGWGSGVVLRGPKGDKGDPGTANVMYADWQKFDWQSRNPYHYRMRITVDQLTEDFMSNGGVVLVYVRVNVNPFGHTYYQLPFDFSKLYNCRMAFFIRTGQNTLFFDLFPTSGNLTDQFVGSSYAFRYVLIPGGINLRKTSPPDPKDYKATCAYYGIPE